MSSLKRRAFVISLVLLFLVGWTVPLTQAEGDCFWCFRVDIAPPGQDPDPEATCFSWGDQEGYLNCMEATTTCILWNQCSIFD